MKSERKGIPGGSDGKESTCQCRRPRFNPWVGKILWRREWLPTPVFTPRESHGQRSLDKEGFPQTLRILTQEKKRLLINGKGPKLRIITTSLWNRGKGQTC